MTDSSAHVTVAELAKSFADAPKGDLRDSFLLLADAVWRDGELTALSAPAAGVLIEQLDLVDDERKGYLAVLLGLLAEAEYPSPGPVAAAVSRGIDTYLRLLDRSGDGLPLRFALLYLLGHLPEQRERILAAAGALSLSESDYSRLARASQALDPADPDVGRVWPAPTAWDLDEDERAFDERHIRGLTPEQLRLNWENDTRTVRAYSGAKAYWAVRNGAPAPETADPLAAAPAFDGVATGADLLARHAAAFRCPSCQASPLDVSGSHARCGRCARAYPIAGGIVDLSADAVTRPSDDDTADLLAQLAAMPRLGLHYEAMLRPAYLRLAGSNWGNQVTIADEDVFLRRQLRDTDGPVLDLAAGAGRWTRIVADTVGADRVLAADMALPMLTVLRGSVPEVPAVLGSALSLPFDDAAFGTVNCWNALQAFPDDAARAVAEIGRCLRPGGTLTMMTFRWDDDPIGRHFQATQYFPSRPQGHLLFDLDDITRWLADAGLRVREQWCPGTFVFLAAERAA